MNCACLFSHPVSWSKPEFHWLGRHLACKAGIPPAGPGFRMVFLHLHYFWLYVLTFWALHLNLKPAFYSLLWHQCFVFWACVLRYGLVFCFLGQHVAFWANVLLSGLVSVTLWASVLFSESSTLLLVLCQLFWVWCLVFLGTHPMHTVTRQCIPVKHCWAQTQWYVPPLGRTAQGV